MSAPIVKFLTEHSNKSITTREIERESEQYVWVFSGLSRANGERATKRVTRGNGWQFHDSWADAHSHLLARAERNVDSCNQALGIAITKLNTIKGMKPPEADQ